MKDATSIDFAKHPDCAAKGCKRDCAEFCEKLPQKMVDRAKKLRAARDATFILAIGIGLVALVCGFVLVVIFTDYGKYAFIVAFVLWLAVSWTVLYRNILSKE